jgi:hypothetical protein
MATLLQHLRYGLRILELEASYQLSAPGWEVSRETFGRWPLLFNSLILWVK